MSVHVEARATHTAVLVLVPAAEPVVGALRDALDPSAPQGVPAHVTVLFPFVPARAVDDGTVATLRRAVRDVAPFSFRLDAVGWFGDDYVWLGAEPAGAVRGAHRAHRPRLPGPPAVRGRARAGAAPDRRLPPPLLARGAAYRRGAARAEPPDRGRGRPRPPARGSLDVGTWHVVAEAPLLGDGSVTSARYAVRR